MASPARTQTQRATWTDVIAGEQTMLIEPQLYMNRSGTALADVMPAVAVSDLIVIHDDLDLELGCVRVKRGGGTAGHHGLDSIVEYGGNDFTRVRIGIGRPARGEDVVDYVLSPFTDEQQRSRRRRHPARRRRSRVRTAGGGREDHESFQCAHQERRGCRSGA